MLMYAMRPNKSIYSIFSGLVVVMMFTGFFGNFGLWINFDVLHFTNSPNAPPP
jgi:hypothetical protein